MFHWRAGDRSLRAELEKALANPTPLTSRSASSSGRRHLRATLPNGEVLFLKRFPARPPRSSRRARLLRAAARALRRSSAEREWHALVAAHAAGVPVPTPRALIALDGGDLVLATDFVAGPTLREGLPSDILERQAVLRDVGDVVRRLHAAGLVHRDLHAGNLLVSQAGAVLVDLQSARRSRSRRARLRDVGALDHSLSRALSRADRLRVATAALALSRPLDPAARRTLSDAARASRARARAHAASRTRRSLRSGRRFASLCIGELRGLRAREIDAAELERALSIGPIGHEAEHDQGVLKLDARARIRVGRVGDRSVVIKEYRAGGPLRRLADVWRGSPARRAWCGGHGMLARGIGAATPLAFLERRRLGVPLRSLAVFEDLRPSPAADALPGEPEALARALVRMLVAMHRAGVRHGDLKASHVFLEGEGDRLSTRLIDLEGVRFRRALSDRQRIQALAELNASLPDAFPDDVRERAFARYARSVPFAMGTARARARVIAQSLARQHRWSGCKAGGPSET